jgi:hypothetical protein
MLAADPADRAALSAVGHLLVGGEVLPTVLAGELRAILPGRFTNMYGPTETTIWSLTHEITEVPRSGIPIGRPIAGTTIAVVDANLQPLPPGSPGELVIGGEGVTRGYLDRPDLTAERFTSVPGIERAYRTGDVARVTPTGVVEFLGRSDHQVKLRGHRIELGEIETALATHPDVGQAVVVAHGRGADTTLLGYVVQADGTRPDEDALRAHVGRVLPEIMVPARAIVLDSFPLTPNGKIDRQALPAPGAGIQALKGGVPDDELERIVAAIWTEVLNRPVGRDDNFFEIGGHSLAAVKVFSRLIAATGAPLSLTDVFQHPTVRTTAQHLARVSAPGAATPGDAPAAGTDRGSRRRQLLARRLAETP